MMSVYVDRTKELPHRGAIQKEGDGCSGRRGNGERTSASTRKQAREGLAMMRDRNSGQKKIATLLAAVIVILAFAGSARANRVLTQQVQEAVSAPGSLWWGSPLYGASHTAKAGFTCGYEGRDCNFVYSDQTGPNGECVAPVIPAYPGNPTPTREEFCAYHMSIPVDYWNGVYHNTSLLSETIPNGPMFGCIIGNNWQANEARRLPGWQGKGFDANSGNFANLVHVGAWHDVTAYPGRFFPTYSQEGGLAWMLDYSVRTGVPLVGGLLDFAINNVMPGQYIRNFGGFKVKPPIDFFVPNLAVLTPYLPLDRMKSVRSLRACGWAESILFRCPCRGIFHSATCHHSLCTRPSRSCSSRRACPEYPWEWNALRQRRAVRSTR